MASSEKRRRHPNRHDKAARLRAARLEGGPQTRLFSKFWLQLLIGVTSTVATTFIVWIVGPPFPYRLNQRVDRQIRLTVDFEIPDEIQTRNQREQFAAQARLAFLHNPQPIIDLEADLAELMSKVAVEPMFEKAENILRARWQLTPELYQGLRGIVPDETALPGVLSKLERIFKPLKEKGILEADEVPSNKHRTTPIIEIYPIGSETQPRLVRIEEVLLDELKRVEGPMGQALRKEFPNGEDASVLFNLLAPRLERTLFYDAVQSQKNEDAEREMADTIFRPYKRGDVVVDQGELIPEEQLRILREEHLVRQQQVTWQQRVSELLGHFVLVAAVYVAIAFYLVVYQKPVVESVARVGVLALLFPLTIGIGLFLNMQPYHGEILPVAVASLLLAVAYSRSFALICTLAWALLISQRHPAPIEQFEVLLGGTAVGILVLDSVRSRTKLIMVGIWTGLAYSILSLGIGLAGQQPWSLVLYDVAWRFLHGLVAGFLISGCLPFIESMFGIVTDISLIELADTSHPLLQQLVQRAPGTYNHSVTVSIIAEAAAAKIGCNSLLVRVGALFHDIGKMLKPQYFIENKSENERNRHSDLAPAMSTLIIIGHVKDGMDLAYQHHLPKPIIALIEQHHGTTLVDYFYFEATRESRGSMEQDEIVEESSFRYPGPRPQSKEAAVLMLADCVESASRALSEPTPARIEKLVHNLALNRLLDGQFDESGLTLEEVRIVEESLIKSLTSVYHGRIKYPVAV